MQAIQGLKAFPTWAQLRLWKKEHPEFPSHSAFNKMGSKAERVQKVLDYCKKAGGLRDVEEIVASLAIAPVEKQGEVEESDNTEDTGFVYLLKQGKYYKIGRTNCVEKRVYEIGKINPEKPSIVHQLETDDPVGIERYWHMRFAEKRHRGEWFLLEPSDVRAFRRRKKFM